MLELDFSLIGQVSWHKDRIVDYKNLNVNFDDVLIRNKEAFFKQERRFIQMMMYIYYLQKKTILMLDFYRKHSNGHQFFYGLREFLRENKYQRGDYKIKLDYFIIKKIILSKQLLPF